MSMLPGAHLFGPHLAASLLGGSALLLCVHLSDIEAVIIR